MNQAQLYSKATGRETDKPVLEEDASILQEHIDWLNSPFTKRFLVTLEKLELDLLKQSANLAEGIQESKVIRKYLHKAAAIRKIIDYGRTGKVRVD